MIYNIYTHVAYAILKNFYVFSYSSGVYVNCSNFSLDTYFVKEKYT